MGTDAVHGDQHVSGSILFPHNIGLSCSHNPNHFYNLGYWTSKNIKRYGFNYAFAPTVAVICVAELITNDATGVPPIVTAVVPVKFVPVITTV